MTILYKKNEIPEIQELEYLIKKIELPAPYLKIKKESYILKRI